MSQAGMPLFPNEDLQSYILDAAGLPDVIDDGAMQAAGLLPEQLDQKDEMADATLENTKNPPEPPSGKGSFGKTKFEKMVLAAVARRMLKQAGPKFGVHTDRHNHKKRR
jgi:hypothetical protein